MIFNTNKDIEVDIKSKISNYIKQNNDINDIKDIISIIRSYLYEMKIIKEIDSYIVDKVNKDEFEISFNKNNNTSRFIVSMNNEMRLIKIDKIRLNKSLDIQKNTLYLHLN